MRVTVYAGEGVGNRAAYRIAAAEFAGELAAAGHQLVCGGAGSGLAAEMVDAAIGAGGRVLGIVPQEVLAAGGVHPRLSEVHATASEQERQEVMAALGDCAVALPGGVATAEEIMRLWAWRVDGRLAAPVLLLNVEGYWDRLLRMSVRMAASGFLDPGEAVAVRPVADAEEFFALTRGLRPAAAAPVSVAAAAR